MTPEEYAGVFSQFRTFVFGYPDSPVERVACGPNGYDWEWTRKFFEELGGRKNGVQAFAAHYYCGTAGTATEYSEDQWLELLAKAAAIEGIVTGHRALLDEVDPERKIKLFLDEWGAWHPVEVGKPRGGLYQQNTIRDACVAALSLDVFHNHADKLVMANIAQLINVLQSLLLVQGDQCIKTPTYHVFDLYKAHQGGQAVRFLSSAETISDGGASAAACRACYLDKQPFALRAVQGSASVKNGSLCTTMVNSHPTQSVEVEIEIYGGTLGAVEVATLAADNIHAHNTFDAPDVVSGATTTHANAQGGTLRVSIPAGGIVRVMGALG
jgi:alpha-N-arabinofuranosidase